MSHDLYPQLYKRGTVSPQRMSVCFIGPPRTGRTTLMNSLQNVSFPSKVEVTRNKGMSFSASRAYIPEVGKVFLCDLGLHSNFPKILQFVCSSNAVVVLLLSLLESENDLRVEAHHFLAYLKGALEKNVNPTVLIAASHSDESCHSQDMAQVLQRVTGDMKLLFDGMIKFSQQSYALDCRDLASSEMIDMRKCLGTLKKQLSDQAACPRLCVPIISQLLPALCEKEGHYFVQKAYLIKEIMEKPYSKVSEKEEAEEIVNFLSKDRKIKLLNNGLAVMDVCQCFSELLAATSSSQHSLPAATTTSQSSQPGVIAKSDVKALLLNSLEAFAIKHSGLGDHQSTDMEWTVERLVHFLEEFGLCIKLEEKSNGKYLVPGQLPLSLRDDVWKHEPHQPVYVGRRQLYKPKMIHKFTSSMFCAFMAKALSVVDPHAIVWQGGLKVTKPLEATNVSLECLMEISLSHSATDFVVRGPQGWQVQCMDFVESMVDMAVEVMCTVNPEAADGLEKRYLSPEHMRHLSQNQSDMLVLRQNPASYDKDTILHAMKMKQTTLHIDGVEDDLRGLVVSPGDVDFFKDDTHYPSRSELKELAGHIKTNLKKVANILHVDPSSLNLNFDDIGVEQGRALLMLEIWQEKQYMEATVDKLCKALDEAGLRHEAEKVFPQQKGSAIWRLGRKGVDNYKRALKKGKLDIIRIMVDLVGEGSAGKSCLGDSLVNAKFKGRKSTEGAEIRVMMRTAYGTGEEVWEEVEGKIRKHRFDKVLAVSAVRHEKNKQTNRDADGENKSDRSLQQNHDVGEKPHSDERESHSAMGDSKKNVQVPETSEDKKESAGDAQAGAVIQPLVVASAVASDSSNIATRQHHEVEINPTEKQASYIETLKQYEEELEKCRKWILITLCDRGGQEQFLAMHAALMSDCKEHSSKCYLVVFNLTKSLCDPALNLYRLTDCGEVKELKCKRAETRQDVISSWMSAVDLAHPVKKECKPVYLHGHGNKIYKVRRTPPMLFVGTHKDVIKKMEEEGKGGSALVEEQEEVIRNLLLSHEYCKRVVMCDEREKKIIFEVDNTRSGTSCRDPVVADLRQLVAALGEYYQGKQPPTPLPWGVVEKHLMTVAENYEGKMVSVQDIAMSVQEYCPTLDECKSALQYLSGFGVVVWWFNVPGLKDTVFTDAQWLIDLLSTYVTVLGKEKVPLDLQNNLTPLKTKGIMSRELAEHLLKAKEKLGVKEENYNTIFRVLQQVDIFCPVNANVEDAKEFFVPCMLEKDYEELTEWQKMKFCEQPADTSACCQPTSLLLKGDNVDLFPEPLFFRLSARTACEYPENPKLKRNRIQAHIAPGIDLELLYHESYRYVIATVFNLNKQRTKHEELCKQCIRIRRFLCWQLEDAKHLGIDGFKFKLYCHFPKEAGKADIQEKCLYPLDPSDQKPSMLTNPTTFSQLPEAYYPSVHMWYCSENRQDNHDTSQCEKHFTDIVEGIGDQWPKLAERMEPRPFFKNEMVKFEDDIDKSEAGKALRMLRAWKEEHEDKATLSYMKIALEASGFQGLAASLDKCDSGKVTPDKFIQVVTNLGHDKAYLFGRKLLPRHLAELDAIIHDHPNYESQLRAIIDKARDRHGDKKTMDILLVACNELGILGGVKDELGIEGEIVFEDISHTSNTPPPKDDYVKGETLADMRSKADSITEPRNLVLVARTIDDKWEECASILDPEEILFTEEKIEEISKQNKSQFLKAKMILKEWRRHFKETATNRMLIEALCDMRITKEASEVFGDELVEFIQQNRST